MKRIILLMVSSIGMIFAPISYFIISSIVNGLLIELKTNTNEAYFKGDVGIWAIDAIKGLSMLTDWIIVLYVIQFLICLVVFILAVKIDSVEGENNEN